MINISSQVLAMWVTKNIKSVEWSPLITVVSDAIQQETNLSADEADELADEHLSFVTECLRDELELHRAAGTSASYELDEEQMPYIRSLIDEDLRRVLATLRTMESSEFETICSDILGKFGATVRVNGGVNDGGVDFIGEDIFLHPLATTIPLKSRAVVIGQAKRYKGKNSVKLNEVRQFVGACKAKVHELKRSNKIGPFSPIICALWTTSSFDLPAAEYASQMGIWYLDGVSIARYVKDLSVQLPAG